MKSCIFHELLLVSRSEKRARLVPFHPKTTLVKGANDTGKSSILKSIYATLGAEPAQSHDRWNQANVTALLSFSVDGHRYASYRRGDTYALFSGEASGLLGTYAKVTRELGPTLARLFDFQLTLADRQGHAITPPPAYLLLPYYIDQDRGWSQTWSSFAKLGQFRDWRAQVVAYHSGIRPNEWYSTNAARKAIELKKQEPLSREQVVRHLRQDVEKTLASARYEIDLDQYRAEVDRLAQQYNALAFKEEGYRAKLLELEGRRTGLKMQIEILLRARKELAADYQFVAANNDKPVECPTCGAAYCNDLLERFEIARDEDRCGELLQEMQDDLLGTDQAIEKQRATLAGASEEARAIESLLAVKKGEVTLRDLISREGAKQLASTLDSELSGLAETLGKLEADDRELAQRLARFEDRERKSRIEQEYRNLMGNFLTMLSVHGLGESSYRRLDCNIRETGSDLPRAILAYVFSMLHLVKVHGSGTFFPIVVDAPNQQEQDPVNHRRMLEFIRDHRPSDSQVVIGLVDDAGVKFDGDVVTLDEENFALRQTDYATLAAQLAPYTDAVLTGPAGP